MTTDYLREKWNSIAYHDGGFLRLDTTHPLEWYVGYQSLEQKTLIIVTKHEISTPPSSSKSIAVTVRRRELDGCWTLAFTLLRNEQEDVFINLCCDILNFSQSAGTEKEAVLLILQRYKQWGRLMEYQSKAVLDEGKKKGLIGELIFLERKIKEGISVLSCVQAWVGPENADQDFFFDSKWYEVKTVGIGASSVKISSLEQLASNEKGYLAVMFVDKSAPDRNDAFSLSQKVNELRTYIHNNAEASELFEEKLAKYGYMDIPEYSLQKYYHSGSKVFLVHDNFPKLTRNNVPSQVISCEYRLSLMDLTEWEVQEV